jgi:hypothetical protein
MKKGYSSHATVSSTVTPQFILDIANMSNSSVSKTNDLVKTLDYYYYSSIAVNESYEKSSEKERKKNENHSVSCRECDESSKLPYCYSPHMFDKTLSEGTVDSNIRFIYVIYCNMIVPLLLNIIPAFIVLILNSFLWFFIRRYTSELVSKNKVS